MKFSTLLSLVSVGSLALAGCGGGGSSPPPNPPAASASKTDVMTFGTISGFGSVIVNGVRYDTSNTQFTDEGAAITQGDLKVGQFVRLQGEVSASGTARAMQIEHDDLLEGPISAIDPVAGTLVVLGQTVVIDADTSFDDRIVPASLAGLALAQWIEVDGLAGPDGVIHATRIEPKAAAGEMEVTGVVSALDTTARAFRIGSLVVNYLQASLDDFPAAGIANGDRVEAKGTALSANGELLATEVELQRLVNRDDVDEIEIEGYITRFASVTDFDVGGHRVTTTGATGFEDGTAADLAIGLKVEVEGELDSAGILVAEEISIRRPGDVRITGAIESIDAAAGRIHLLGLQVQLDGRTRFEDKTAAGDMFLSTARLAVGDRVEIRGFEDPAKANRVIATRLERDDDGDNEVELRGRVQQAAVPVLTILGVRIDTTATTQFRDDDTTISATTFFDRAADRIVEAEGNWNGASIIAHEAELEDDARSTP